MIMNKKGKGSGLALIHILVVALLIAFLAIKNTDSLGRGNTTPQQEDYVQQAKDVVDQINQTQLQGRQAP
jgi:hypothetical protein